MKPNKSFLQLVKSRDKLRKQLESVEETLGGFLPKPGEYTFGSEVLSISRIMQVRYEYKVICEKYISPRILEKAKIRNSRQTSYYIYQIKKGGK